MREHRPDQEPDRNRTMVRVELDRWGQRLQDLRHAALHAAHPRTRERFQALYLIASGQFNATTCAEHIGRSDETVLGWVHRYNTHGPDVLAYRRTGGRAPLLTPSKPNGSSKPSRRPSQPTTDCPDTCGH
jgi:Homeodomain-like domain